MCGTSRAACAVERNNSNDRLVRRFHPESFLDKRFLKNNAQEVSVAWCRADEALALLHPSPRQLAVQRLVAPLFCNNADGALLETTPHWIPCRLPCGE